MRILYITHYAGMYGANQSMCSLLLDLRAMHGINPLVLIPRNGPICDHLDEMEVDYLVTPFYWWVNSEKGLYKALLNVRKQFLNYGRVGRFVEKLKGHEIDLVYSNSVTINIGYFISRRLGCPHIWHLRESLESYGFKFSLGEYFAKYFFSYSAERYLVISDYLLQFYTPYLPLARVTRVYNGVTVAALRPNVFVQGTVHMVSVGVVSDQKNQLDALRAALLLKQRGHTDFCLHFVGAAKGDYLVKLQKFVKENQLENFCQFHGHQTDIYALLSTMHLGLMTSRDEAFGRVSIECMLHGLPVIASNSGANPELIREGENGYLYELYDAEALANRMEYFMKQLGELQRMGAQARTFAEANFSREQNTRAIYEVIQEALSPAAIPLH